MADIESKGVKKFVRVTWWDAEDYAEGWAGEKDATTFNDKPCIAISYGFLVAKNKNYLTVAADFIGPTTYGRLMKIPTKMVKSIEEVDLSPPKMV